MVEEGKKLELNLLSLGDIPFTKGGNRH